MQIEFNPLSSVKIEAKVLLSADEVNPFFDKALNKYEKSVRLDGFRKGHIPKDTLLQFYGSQIGYETVDEITRKFGTEVLNQLQGRDDIDLVSNRASDFKADTPYPTRNKDWSFSLVFENYPKVEKKDLSDIHLDLYDIQVNDADIEVAINRLRQMRAKHEVVDDLVVTKGEHQLVNINFLGKKDGVPFEGGTAEKFDFDIDHASMIEGFAEGIVGHKAGDEFTINLTFPDDYRVEDLRGAPVTFDIKVNSVSKFVVPEFNEDLVKEYGFTAEQDILESFKQSLKNNIEAQAKNLRLDYNLRHILDALLPKYPELDAPESLIEVEANRYAEDAFRPYGFKDVPADMKASVLAQCRIKCKPGVLRQCLSMGLVKAFDFDDLDITPEELDAELEAFACVYEEADVDLEKFKKEAQDDKEVMSICRNSIYSRKLEKALMNIINHDIKVVSFEEFGAITRKEQEEAQAAQLAAMAAKNAEAN